MIKNTYGLQKSKEKGKEGIYMEKRQRVRIHDGFYNQNEVSSILKGQDKKRVEREKETDKIL